MIDKCKCGKKSLDASCSGCQSTDIVPLYQERNNTVVVVLHCQNCHKQWVYVPSIENFKART